MNEVLAALGMNHLDAENSWLIDPCDGCRFEYNGSAYADFNDDCSGSCKPYNTHFEERQIFAAAHTDWLLNSIIEDAANFIPMFYLVDAFSRTDDSLYSIAVLLRLAVYMNDNTVSHKQAAVVLGVTGSIIGNLWMYFEAEIGWYEMFVHALLNNQDYAAEWCIEAAKRINFCSQDHIYVKNVIALNIDDISYFVNHVRPEPYIGA